MRDLETDFSPYRDEYGFMPLSPDLDRSLEQIISKARDGADEFGMVAIERDGGFLTDAKELERLGYVSKVNFMPDGRTVLLPMAKGYRYRLELERYEDRKRIWAEARRREARAERRWRIWTALLGLIGAVVGAAATIAASYLVR